MSSTINHIYFEHAQPKDVVAVKDVAGQVDLWYLYYTSLSSPTHMLPVFSSTQVLLQTQFLFHTKPLRRSVLNTSSSFILLNKDIISFSK